MTAAGRRATESAGRLDRHSFAPWTTTTRADRTHVAPSRRSSARCARSPRDSPVTGDR